MAQGAALAGMRMPGGETSTVDLCQENLGQGNLGHGDLGQENFAQGNRAEGRIPALRGLRLTPEPARATLAESLR
ncbi:hypothetical protein [Methylobacterium sp. J-076]|uniref:hypothetical protein n=1 Tax=Methylobacterium sp. J-076 TaxID=2836655 RepID=UPI001FB9009B|nr:hypothetical protein [Methylobacterium sp. J-076]MCJ2012129.1 hypothetical protein [Methylobacterium sp. J-076]